MAGEKGVGVLNETTTSMLDGEMVLVLKPLNLSLSLGFLISETHDPSQSALIGVG